MVTFEEVDHYLIKGRKLVRFDAGVSWMEHKGCSATQFDSEVIVFSFGMFPEEFVAT